MSLRNGMPLSEREEKSRQIGQKLCGTKIYCKADVLLAYVDYQSEVITTPMISRALEEGKQVFVPKVTGEEMEFYQIKSLDVLTEGYKGIREPASGQIFRISDKAWNSHNLLMMMPGAVFDTARHRIGYGKGFYDRYLNRLTEEGMAVYTAALCYECQMLPAIPYEAHDICPDLILTEERMIAE